MPVALMAEPDEVVILGRHLRAGPGEVQRERRHLPAQVVDPEDEILGQRVRVPPHDPAHPGIDQPVLVPGGVDRRHPRHPEVPLQVRLQERRDEPAGRPVHVHRDVVASFGLHPVERLADLEDGLVAAVHGGAQDRHHADGVLVALRRGLGAAQMQPPRHHRHVAGLDLPVAAELLPAHLDVGAHHQVRPAGVLASGPAPLAPPPQQRHPAEHARLARPGGGAARRRTAGRRVPQVADDVHAAPLELGGLRILVLVDHVLGGEHSAISSSASGSIQVVTNVARLSRALPSRMSSSRTTCSAVRGSTPCSGSRYRGISQLSSRT